jgi:hypothetical protein
MGWNLGLRVQGFRVQGFRVQGFRVQRCRVYLQLRENLRQLAYFAQHLD